MKNLAYSLQSFQLIALGFLLSIIIVLINPASVFAATKTWDGEGGDDNWTTAANWDADTAPVAGDDLVFDTDAANFNDDSPNNDFGAGTLFNSIAAQGSANDYDINLTGNDIDIAAGISNTSKSGLTIANNLMLTADQEINNAAVTGSIDLNGNTLTASNGAVFFGVISGSGGNLVIGSGISYFYAENTYDGTTTVNGDGTAILKSKASFGSSALTVEDGAFFGGTGMVGTIIILSGGTLAPGQSPGCLSSGDLTLAGTFEVEIEGSTVCTEYDQTDVTGTVDVTGATLDIQLTTFDGIEGAEFIIINNDGSDDVTGEFAGLAEGDTVTAGGVEFEISYAGGDGNDVVLTATTAGAPDTGFPMLGVDVVVPLMATLSATALLILIPKLQKN